MKIERCELHFLRIPLRMSVTHGARAERTFSDSVVVAISSAGFTGYGEAVVRDYVSGSLGEGSAFQREASRTVARLIAPLEGRFSSWASLQEYLAAVECDDQELPLLCAVETALLDVACRWENKDIYSLLGRAPVRNVVSYGAIMAILQPPEAEKHLRMCAGLGFSNMKIKVNGDALHTATILELSRKILGERFDIRVDANCSWPVDDAGALFDVCRRFHVGLVEQPF
ncbi:MAG TPA: enolase C-terminal domain-like protein, partial [Spirochaetia bacterium]|nr:enolase C-terminal domain-like protein [Spirochaetia bacterium]